jgi:hypothetical protein
VVEGDADALGGARLRHYLHPAALGLADALDDALDDHALARVPGRLLHHVGERDGRRFADRLAALDAPFSVGGGLLGGGGGRLLVLFAGLVVGGVLSVLRRGGGGRGEARGEKKCGECCFHGRIEVPFVGI